MNKKKLLALLAKKNERKQAINTQAETCENVEELRKLNVELTGLNEEIRSLQEMADSMPDDVIPSASNPAGLDENGQSERTRIVNGEVPGIVIANANSEELRGKQQEVRSSLETVEKRGKNLLEGKAVDVDARNIILTKENRSVTVGSSNIVVPTYVDNTLSPTFNEVSSLVDRVSSKMLVGGESYKKGYVSGYGTAGQTLEGEDYAEAEPTFAYADINKTKITAYAEDTEEILKLTPVNYDAEVMNGIRIACRKKLSREILVGTGATNRFAGIFSTAATAIEAAKDLSVSEIDEDTLDDIIFGYGGDENVEDAAVLILNKSDLKAFSKLRDANGNKLHKIMTSGNTGTIDTVPYIINSACYSVASATAGQYCMAYGPLSNYQLTIFSSLDVQRSTDYKFKQGMIAHRGSIFAGGNVIAKNGFLRVKKG